MSCWWPLEQASRGLPVLSAGNQENVVAGLECIFLLIPSLTGRGFGECFYTYILMVADAATGLIAGIDLLSTEDQPFEEMIDSIPDRFLAICDKSQLKPRGIATSSKATAALLAFPAKALGCKVRIAKRLPAVDAAMATMPI
jgi:hypothetical protein